MAVKERRPHQIEDEKKDVLLNKTNGVNRHRHRRRGRGRRLKYNISSTFAK